jgi:hypothetical protein
VGGRYTVSHLISPLLFAEVQCLRWVFQREGIKVIRQIKTDGRKGVYEDQGLTHYKPRGVQPLVDMCHARNISISTLYTELKLKADCPLQSLRHVKCKVRNEMPV